VNHGTVKGEQIRTVVKDDPWLNTEFLKLIQLRGAEIIKLRKTSSAFSAANATKDHLRDWYFGTPSGEWVSMGVVSDGTHYNVPTEVVYSFPIVCKGNFQYEVVDGLKVDDFSKEKMETTLKELQQERTDAQSLWGGSEL